MKISYEAPVEGGKSMGALDFEFSYWSWPSQQWLSPWQVSFYTSSSNNITQEDLSITHEGAHLEINVKLIAMECFENMPSRLAIYM